MSEKIRIASKNEIKTGKMFRAIANDSAILVANIEGTLYAIDDTCTHEDASLYRGALKGDCVECPLHGSHFSFITGKPDGNPATEAVKTYQLETEGDEVFVILED